MDKITLVLDPLKDQISHPPHKTTPTK